MAAFDDFMQQYYPAPHPAGVRETAIIAWNAAIHAALDSAGVFKDECAERTAYEAVATVRDVMEVIRQLVKVRE